MLLLAPNCPRHLIQIRDQIFDVHPTKLEQLRNGLLDHVVGTRCTRSNPNLHLSFGQPPLRSLLILGMLVIVLNLIR